jgi:hypothetical protein
MADVRTQQQVKEYLLDLSPYYDSGSLGLFTVFLGCLPWACSSSLTKMQARGECDHVRPSC